MPWIDLQGNTYSSLPKRVRLADKTTRTAEEVTEELVVNELKWSTYTPEPSIVFDTLNEEIGASITDGNQSSLFNEELLSSENVTLTTGLNDGNN